MKKLAKIKSASLSLQSAGVFTFWINVDYEDGLSQNVGGYALDTYDADKKCRVGTAYGCEMIRRLLEEFGINDFSEMAGKYVWVIGEEGKLGFQFRPTGIKRLSCDRVDTKGVMFDEIFRDFKTD